MKKIIALFILLSMLASLVSCFGGDDAKADPAFVNEVAISEYSIVVGTEGTEYDKRAAEYIRDNIKASCGVELGIVDDSTPEAQHEIVVGETSRPISASLNEATEGLEFSFKAEGGNFALEGDYFIVAAAAYFFIDCYKFEGGSRITAEDTTIVRDPIVKEAKNFIILIGDGMGLYQTKMFEYVENNVEYGDGEDIFYGYYLPYMGYSKTDSLSGTTDSAAGATAISCGTKTANGIVGCDAEGNVLTSLTELAYYQGMAAAVMSTETKTGATPAAFSSHTDSRNNTKEIGRDQVEAKQNYGTIIDCGYNYYTEKYMETVIEKHITDTLAKLSENEKGFFLMYEEAYIDKHCYNNDFNYTMQALVRFNQAIARFMEYAFYNPETFVLITADHETGDLRPNENGELVFNQYDHSSANVPIFAYGDGAELFDGVEIENIQIGHTIASFMGKDDFGDQSVYQSLTK